MKMDSRSKAMMNSYFGLVRRFPLVPLESHEQYASALDFMKPLAVRDEQALDEGQRAYLAALTQFVADYEQRHHRIETRGMSPLGALKYLLRENGMKPIDLGKLLGSRSLASQILHGARGLSKTHIAILRQRFCVEPGLFFEKKPAMQKVG